MTTTAITTRHLAHEPHESPWVVTVPLILLAIPSIVIGFLTIGPMLFGTDWIGHHEQMPFFLGSIDVSGARDAMGALKESSTARSQLALHGFTGAGVLARVRGLRGGDVIYLFESRHCRRRRAQLRAGRSTRAGQQILASTSCGSGGFAGGGLALGEAVARAVDGDVIDGVAVNGSARLVDAVRQRRCAGPQSGYLYHYAFAMILGLIALLGRAASSSGAELTGHTRTVSNWPLLSAADLAADPRRRADRWRSATPARSAARWLALAIALLTFVAQHPAADRLRFRAAGHAVRRDARVDPGLRHPATTSAPTASRSR